MDDNRFLEIFNKYDDAVLRYCVALVGNLQDAQDCMQETFIKLYKQSLDEEDHIKNWLYKTAHNECMSLFRKPWKRIRFDDNLIEHMSSYDDSSDVSLLYKCPVKQREVLYLYYYEGYSQKEITLILRISLDAVKQRMVRGREAIKIRLEEEVKNHELKEKV